MRISFPCLLLTTALWAGAACAAGPEAVQKPVQKQVLKPVQNPVKNPVKKTVQAPPETEVQESLESIVTSCEKKKLPQDKEIECIEQGYRRFMGVPEPEGS